MQLMRLLDKDGVRVRRSRRLQRRRYVSKVSKIHVIMLIIMCLHFDLQGPNYVWHIDGYDKLKQFGFAKHGCVDGLVATCKCLYVMCCGVHQVQQKNNMDKGCLDK